MDQSDSIMAAVNRAIDEMEDLGNDVMIREELEKLTERLEKENKELLEEKLEESCEPDKQKVQDNAEEEIEEKQSAHGHQQDVRKASE